MVQVVNRTNTRPLLQVRGLAHETSKVRRVSTEAGGFAWVRNFLFLYQTDEDIVGGGVVHGMDHPPKQSCNPKEHTHSKWAKSQSCHCLGLDEDLSLSSCFWLCLNEPTCGGVQAVEFHLYKECGSKGTRTGYLESEEMKLAMWHSPANTGSLESIPLWE